MNKDEAARFCAFHRRSRYDIIQARQEDAWGTSWTFAPCNPKAAEQVALMLKRMGVRRVRHSRRARLIVHPGEHIEAVVTTELPERQQTVLRLADAFEFRGLVFLRDDCLLLLEEAFHEGQTVGLDCPFEEGQASF